MTLHPRTTRPTRRGSLRRISLLAGLVALLLSACSGSTGSDGSDSQTPKAGGEITLGLNSPIECVDPHLYQSNAHQFIIRNVVDSLVDQDVDTGEIKPWLAASWQVSADGKVYTFTLRDGVTFSDGTPFTAESVKANFDRQIELGAAKSPWAVRYLEGYEGSEVIDERNVAVRFARPNVQFIQGASTTSLGIVADSTLAATDAERCGGAVVGTGPFTIDEHQPGQQTRLVKRAGYAWASELRKHEGEAYLDAAVFKTIPEAGVRSGQLKSGELDVDTIPLTEDLPFFEGDDGYGILGRVFPGINQTFLPNLQRPITQDPEVRRALSLGIDRTEIVDGLLTKFDRLPTSVIAANTPDYTKLSEFPYDPDAARSALDRAGWLEGSDGTREKDGTPLRLVAALQPAGRQSLPVIELVQQQLRDIGVDLQIRQMSPADAAELQKTGDFDIWFTPSYRADPDIVRGRLSFYGDNLGKAAAARPADELLVSQAAETDPDARHALVDDALGQLIEQGDAIPLYELAGLYVYNARVHGLDVDATSLLTIYDTWVAGS